MFDGEGHAVRPALDRANADNWKLGASDLAPSEAAGKGKALDDAENGVEMWSGLKDGFFPETPP